ncbi:site-specific DNA-methyltransferase [Chryseobacterium profundimaris]|uniref:site-specific DNA-methyltransferase (adenine-specific) n=1 Tax=Chryseobacterium profundimaris TaxID=1387275 RepID=A0ABY1NTV9_9FLAO|nr:site-specific DNA-methyltransferase [Chryseobacterium profundimaris]SMP18018.1 adenine-specific DNA-methyltransferase [Chryseobacterium profundimaris]
MEKINELTSENIVQQNIERLKEIFPTAFSEGKLVVEELQALVGEYIQKDKEFYQMTWAGKTEAQREANKISTGTLRPSKVESKNWDSTGNIFIEGDNLEVLKLLQKSYSNKIKMIYIDPPYNTGKDFVYKDNYKDNLNNYLELTGQTDVHGRKFSTNTDSDGRYHSNWMNMIYPRLKLARNLLKDDGVIFISLDDIEIANLRKICDEIFGEENFINNIIWEKKYTVANDAKYFSDNHDHILMYVKSKEKFEIGRLQRSEEMNSAYRNPDNHPKGVWKATPLQAKSGSDSKFQHTFPNGVNWSPPQGRFSAYSSNTLNELYNKNEIWFGADGKSTPAKKTFLTELKNTGVVPRTILTFKEAGHNHESKDEIKKLFNSGTFDTPKPTKLIKLLQTIANIGDNSIILDFFAGSSTTADAVMQLNSENGGSNRFMMVQIPELTNENSEAYSEGYKNICEIGKERIRRAGELILTGIKDKKEIDKLDIGFRVFKLDSSNIQAWDTSVDKFEGQLDIFAENNGDHIKANRTEEDVLFEILLKYGLELTLPIEERSVRESKIYNIGFGSMYICLSDIIKTDVATAIGEWHRESSEANPSVIFKDSGFANDADKTNTVQTLRQAGIENVKSI